jgi:hypothetical protein
MKTKFPLSNWSLCQLDTHGALPTERINALSAKAAAFDWIESEKAAQVASILLAAGRIEDPRGLNKAKECLWIAESDWAYRTTFAAPTLGTKAFLNFQGLDTVADLYLNGEKIAEHRDIYLPTRVDVTGKLKDKNTLVVHFQSPHEYIKHQPWDERWTGPVHRNRVLRKPHEDFNSFNGAFPYFTPIGIFDDVLLETVDAAELTYVDIDYHFENGAVKLAVTPEISGTADEVVVTVLDPSGLEISTSNQQPITNNPLRICIANPQRWWPLGYGEQPLYTVVTELKTNGKTIDRIEKIIGLREIEMGGDFDLRCNGVKVKLWGSNFAPVEQFTHEWPEGRVDRLIELAKNSHTVTLRLWGPGAPYGDELYDACDRAGILLWSELYHTWGMFPDSPEFFAQCKREAEHHVRKYKHHACVFMWCGGNEVHMGVDVMRPGQRVISRELYHEIYPAVCAALDPKRYYHIDSPTGGDFPNDPLKGDTHGYTHFWFVRGCDYPVILTENARWSPPKLQTLEKYIGDQGEVWPEGFVSKISHRRAPASGPGAPTTSVAGNDGAIETRDFYDNGLIPPAWQRLGKDGNVTNRRAGPLGDFYDTGDSAEGLIYRIGSAHSEFLRRDIERLRRGKPHYESHLPRRTMGHYWWRFNGTWPLIESEIIDYLLEPKMAYYAVARAQSPLLLSFEFANHAYLWLTNDTGAEVSGTVVFQMLKMGGGAPVWETKKRVTIGQSESAIVLPLDNYGMFNRNLVLTARLLDDDGNVLAATTDFPEIEVNLTFPDTELKLEQTGPDRFTVSAGQYVRSVHLSLDGARGNGKTDLFPAFVGDGPTPYFSDNYFHLAPGEAREIRILGGAPQGTVIAKGWWCSQSASLPLT